jgi:4-carboxymuconolactone decarboxylase
VAADETPRARGERLFRKIDGDRVADNLLREYERVAPDFVRYLAEFAFGEIYAREGDLRQRELVAIASLATMGGCDRQLETHVHGAFNVGLSEAEVVEAVMTLIPYIGFPRTLNAVAVVKRVVEKRHPPTSTPSW